MEQNEGKEKIKISLKTAVLLISIITITVIVITIYLTIYFYGKNQNNNTKKIVKSEDYKTVVVNGRTYYQRLNKNIWNGKYHQDSYRTAEAVENIMEVVSYKDYLNTIDDINSIIRDEIEPYYSNKNCNYILLAYSTGYSWCKMDLINCIEEDNKIVIYGDEDSNGVMADGSGYFIAIPTNMPVGTEIEYIECYSNSEIKNLKKYNVTYDPLDSTVKKPIIYLYPTKEENVSVKLLKDENITCSYPKYVDEWNVLAEANGNLKDLSTNRELYSLYYESQSEKEFKVEDEGFIIKGEDSDKFLEEKLSILGLTEREAEEFIVYWLPILEANKYNYIRFATLEEINENMPLEINPNPDTIIRVLMTFKGLENPISVKQQQLEVPIRTGFVAVEWGGVEIK